MHNSKTHSPLSRFLLRALSFVLVLVAANIVLNYALVPNSLARVDLARACHTSYDDLFIGTSHGLSALNPENFDAKTGRRSTNLCMPNERLTDSYYLIRQICKTHKPSRVIYELDPSYWSCPYTNGESTNYIYANMPASLLKLSYSWEKNAERDFRDTLFPWHYYRGNLGGVLKLLREKQGDAYKTCDISALSTQGMVYSEEGYLAQYNDPDAYKIAPDYALWDREELKDREILFFDKLRNFCEKNGIELVVITTPVPAESYTAHKDVYEDAHEYFSAFMEARGILYMDCNTCSIEEEGFDPTLRGYIDHEGHMLAFNADAFSTWLGEQLAK